MDSLSPKSIFFSCLSRPSSRAMLCAFSSSSEQNTKLSSSTRPAASALSRAAQPAAEIEPLKPNSTFFSCLIWPSSCATLKLLSSTSAHCAKLSSSMPTPVSACSKALQLAAGVEALPPKSTFFKHFKRPSSLARLVAFFSSNAQSRKLSSSTPPPASACSRAAQPAQEVDSLPPKSTRFSTLKTCACSSLARLMAFASTNEH
mmetsp:Transcript_6336/g.16188  ORF Transcript_6336/g.16188 Transcript_6336/m.16188 type:complete len:203 (+) Transcript_6336:745-1353(+)